MCVCVCIQVREHTSHLEAELEKHMAASSAECQSYAKEVAGVSLPGEVSSPSWVSPSMVLINRNSRVWALGLLPWPWAS